MTLAQKLTRKPLIIVLLVLLALSISSFVLTVLLDKRIGIVLFLICFFLLPLIYFLRVVILFLKNFWRDFKKSKGFLSKTIKAIVLLILLIIFAIFYLLFFLWQRDLLESFRIEYFIY